MLTLDLVHNEELQSMRNAAMNPRSQQYGQTIRASSDPFTNGYTHLATPHGMPTPDPAEGWSSAPLSAIPVTVTTAVSSPASCGPSDDYRYHSSSAPMIEPISVPPTSVPYQHDIEYENGVDSSSEDTQARMHHEYSRGMLGFLHFFFQFLMCRSGLTKINRSAL